MPMQDNSKFLDSLKPIFFKIKNLFSNTNAVSFGTVSNQFFFQDEN